MPLLRTDGSCAASCDANQVPEANVCQPCSAYCVECSESGDPDKCVACHPDKFQVEAGKCRDSCLPSQHHDPGDNVCYGK